MSTLRARAEEDLSKWWGQLTAAAEESEHALNLVPSENRLSPLARMPLSTDFYNRYFFNDELRDDFWEFRGGEDIGAIERDFVLPNLAELARVGDREIYVNARPISGLSAMLMTVSAQAGPSGTPVAYVARSTGGHFATESLISRLGFVPRAVRFDRGQPDESSFRAALDDQQVKLLYLDLQNFVGAVDVAATVALAKAINPGLRIHVDASHTLGLVFGGVLANPLAVGADSFGGSTHKSFPGPQKGVLFTGETEIRQRFLSAQFDLVSSHHFAETVALGIAACEFRHFGPAYARQVVANAKHLAAELAERGFTVHDADSIATHQIWVPPNDDFSIWRFTQEVKFAGIRLNVQTDLPGIPGPCLRLGTNEVTFLGAGPESMMLLAETLADARDNGVCKPHARDRIRETFGEPFFVADTSSHPFSRPWRT
ncbi:hypothetical protein [Kribbella sp. NPDC051718]|uniref:hypothetical protein n=1 Tax=Kribbella sp. NPDC051718 TaxID=3155168 RepID=UPI003447385F